MSVAKNIRRIRKEKHMTQKQLGNLCNIDEANIRKYELGKVNPKIGTAEKIAKALGVSVLELLDLNIDELTLVQNGKKMNAFASQQKANDPDGVNVGTEKDSDNREKLELYENFQKLNKVGRKEARKRVQELTEIPRYTKR